MYLIRLLKGLHEKTWNSCRKKCFILATFSIVLYCFFGGGRRGGSGFCPPVVTLWFSETRGGVRDLGDLCIPTSLHSALVHIRGSQNIGWNLLNMNIHISSAQELCCRYKTPNHILKRMHTPACHSSNTCLHSYDKSFIIGLLVAGSVELLTMPIFMLS